MRRCYECDEPERERHRLNREGVCAWRVGCEGRQRRYAAQAEAVLQALTPPEDPWRQWETWQVSAKPPWSKRLIQDAFDRAIHFGDEQDLPLVVSPRVYDDFVRADGSLRPRGQPIRKTPVGVLAQALVGLPYNQVVFPDGVVVDLDMARHVRRVRSR